MKVKHLVLLGFILSAISYLSKQIEEEKGNKQSILGELEDIDLQEVREELGSKLEKAIIEFGDVVGAIAKIGSDAFDEFLSDEIDDAEQEALIEKLKEAVAVKEEVQEDNMVELPHSAFDDLLNILGVDEEEFNCACAENCECECNCDCEECDCEECDCECECAECDEEPLTQEATLEIAEEVQEETVEASTVEEAEEETEVQEEPTVVEEDLWRIPEDDNEAILKDLQETLNAFFQQDVVETPIFEEISELPVEGEMIEEETETYVEEPTEEAQAVEVSENEEETPIIDETEVETEETPEIEEEPVVEETEEEIPTLEEVEVQEEVEEVDFDENQMLEEIQQAVEKKEPEKELDELFDELLKDTHNLVEKEINKEEIDAIFQEILEQEQGEDVQNIVEEVTETHVEEPAEEETQEEDVSEAQEDIEVETQEETPVVEETQEEVSEDPQDYVKELTDEIPEIMEKYVPDVYDQINELYPYLSKSFVRSVYDLKETIAAEYPIDVDVIALHRVHFHELEDLRQFVEIVTSHAYGVNVDENKMIVDLFKLYRNTDGKILTNIFEIANQAKLLHGEYEGYRVEIRA